MKIPQENIESQIKNSESQPQAEAVTVSTISPISSDSKQPFPPSPHTHGGTAHFAFSRILLAFVILAVIAFSVLYAGIYMNLNKEVSKATNVGRATTSPSPTCRSRPACLDATPRCLIPQTSDMCPKK